MKKILFIVVMAMLLVGCGKAKDDPVVNKMVNDIAALGDVSLSDADTVNKLLERYNALTDDQKEGVTNYIDLLEAQDKIDLMTDEAMRLIAEEQANAEKQKKTEEEVDAYIKQFVSANRSTIDEMAYPNFQQMAVMRCPKTQLSDAVDVFFISSSLGNWARLFSKGLSDPGSSDIKKLDNPDSEYEYKITDNLYSDIENWQSADANLLIYLTDYVK